ncbi:MAG: hypothetical protein GX950_01105 [Candidatus Diapherotrites archaeon]|jgi:hypothetical protein|uniref:Uncharacterized protein n=1 Tax=Candidatus Iainarchaeum sp. TaxID=3101447 RepID=A0A7K4BYW8_9ARCH|nr:hypothetical protein [Candidatus Diapherotrites archaeon]
MSNYLRNRQKKAEQKTLEARNKLREAAKEKNQLRMKIKNLEVQKAQEEMLKLRYLRLVKLAEKAKKQKHPTLAKNLTHDAKMIEREFLITGKNIEKLKKELTTALKTP